MSFESARPDDDVVLQYSAGCTGGAKRVPRTHAQLRAEADSLVATLGLSLADVLFSTIPLFHSYGMGTAACSPRWRAGRPASSSRTPTRSCSSATARSRSLERERVDGLPGGPVHPPAAGRGAGRTATCPRCACASPPRPRCRGRRSTSFLDRFGVPIRQLYGSTEAGAVTANVDDDPRRHVALGRAAARGRGDRGARRRTARRSRTGTSARSPSAARP